MPGFDGVLPLSHHKRHVSPTFDPVAGLPVSDDHMEVFFNAANLGKRRGSRRLCLSFFQVAQVFFALGQDITYLAYNAPSILLCNLQNRLQGFQVKRFSF